MSGTKDEQAGGVLSAGTPAPDFKARRSDDFRDPHRLDAFAEVPAIGSVAIAQQIPRRCPTGMLRLLAATARPRWDTE
jgi:hypothetical protein